MKRLIIIIILFLFFSCEKKNNSSIIALTTNPPYEKAKQFQKTNVPDSAFYYFNLAKNDFLTTGDSLGVARALTNMAIIQSDKGDYYGSIESSLKANRFIKKIKNDSLAKVVLSSNYNNLAIASSNLKFFDSAVSYYNKALEYVNVEEKKFIYYNNIADALISQKKFKLAKKFLEKALATKNDISYARALNNLAKAKYLENDNYNALPELHKALEIRKQNNDSWAENSSYATLADYFYNRNKEMSLFYAKKMLDKATQIKSPDDQIEALQKIITLDNSNYLKYLLMFLSINDSLQTARSRNKDQFAFFRYDIEGKAVENERLKANKTMIENENLKQKAALTGLSLSLIGIFFWYRRRQKRLQQEKELEVKNTELKYSKKVHDKVANKVYHVMSEVENIPNVDKNELLDKLETIYHISRDISYEDKEGILEQNFPQQLAQMLTSYSSDSVKVITIGNEEEIWNHVTDSSKIEIYYILQEFMTNMKKHSHADRVITKFIKENSTISISYLDNGVGIQSLSPKNGLKNTVNRINSINGTINFDTETETGLKITLSFPTKN